MWVLEVTQMSTAQANQLIASCNEKNCDSQSILSRRAFTTFCLQVTARRLQETSVSVPKQYVTPEANPACHMLLNTYMLIIYIYNYIYKQYVKGFGKIKAFGQVCNARTPRQFYCSFDADCKSDCKAEGSFWSPEFKDGQSHSTWMTIHDHPSEFKENHNFGDGYNFWWFVDVLQINGDFFYMCLTQSVLKGVFKPKEERCKRSLGKLFGKACGWKSATDRAFSICVQPSPEAKWELWSETHCCNVAT